MQGGSKKIAVVLALALLLRIGVPLAALAVAEPAPQFREPDTAGYVRVADEWWRTGSFAVRGEPEIVRTPGYPLLLLPGVAAGRVELVTIGLQAILGCITVWLVYRIAEAAFASDSAALAAAWLCACEPVSIIYASKLLTETLFATIITAALWFLIRFAASLAWRDLTAAAFAVAAAAYVRPIAYFLPFLIALALPLAIWRQPVPRKPWLLKSAVLVVLAIALLVPWQARNWFVAGYAGFSAISDVNLYYYEALPILAEQQGIGPAERDRARVEAGETDLAIYLRRHPEQTDWPAAARYRFLKEEASRIIRAHPRDCARLHLAGLLHTMADSGRNAWLEFFRIAETRKPNEAPPPRGLLERFSAAVTQRPLVLLVHGLLAAILVSYLALAAMGVLGSWRLPATVLLLALFLYLFVLSGGDAGYHRFRVPLTPILCVFAGQGYQMLLTRLRRTA